MTPRPASIPNENRQVRSAFILGAFLRLSPAFLLSAPAGSTKDGFDDCVTATRAYCMGEELDNRAAESAWREQIHAEAWTLAMRSPRSGNEPAANDRACKLAA